MYEGSPGYRLPLNSMYYKEYNVSKCLVWNLDIRYYRGILYIIYTYYIL